MGSTKLSHQRNISQFEPVNRNALLLENARESALRKIDTRRIDNRKIEICLRDLFDLFKVTKVIGCDDKVPAMNQRLTDRL